MDIAAAYDQIPVHQEDVPKTAFCSHYGLMVCGNAIYLDDVIVFGRNFDQHLSRLEAVLERIQKAGLKLKPSKCHIYSNQR